MPRIVVCMAVANLAVLLATAVLGLWSGWANLERHIVLAVFSLVVSSLCQVAVFTYFTITGKIIGQAIHLGHLDPAPMGHVRRMKQSVTRMLAMIIASVVLVTATGASSWRLQQPAETHLPVALLLIAVHAVVYYREYVLVRQNARLADHVLASYEEKKRRRRDVEQDR